VRSTRSTSAKNRRHRSLSSDLRSDTLTSLHDTTAEDSGRKMPRRAICERGHESLRTTLPRWLARSFTYTNTLKANPGSGTFPNEAAGDPRPSGRPL
jgi:hypothetical protein